MKIAQGKASISMQDSKETHTQNSYMCSKMKDTYVVYYTSMKKVSGYEIGQLLSVFFAVAPYTQDKY